MSTDFDELWRRLNDRLDDLEARIEALEHPMTEAEREQLTVESAKVLREMLPTLYDRPRQEKKP